MHVCKQDFLTWTIDSLDFIILCWGGVYPRHCRIFRNIHDLYLLDASVIAPSPSSCDNKKGLKIAKGFLGDKTLKTSDETYHSRILTIGQMFGKIICYDMIITSWQWVIVSDLEKIVWVSHYLEFILPSKSWKFMIVWICHVFHRLTFMSRFYKSNTSNSEMLLTTDWLIKLSSEQNNWQEKGTHYRTTLFIETRWLRVTCKTSIWGYSQF